jgi:hypothetical protein
VKTFVDVSRKSLKIMRGLNSGGYGKTEAFGREKQAEVFEKHWKGFFGNWRGRFV